MMHCGVSPDVNLSVSDSALTLDIADMLNHRSVLFSLFRDIQIFVCRNSVPSHFACHSMTPHRYLSYLVSWPELRK
jgi:hypothetical protein